jgi:hypothetical protein
VSTDDAFRCTVDRLAVALNAFVNGDAEPYKSCWSRASTVSIFGGWGAYERGWDQVGPRLEWAAARFVSGRIN